MILGVGLKNITTDLDTYGLGMGTVDSVLDRDCYDPKSKIESGQPLQDNTPFILSAFSFLEHVKIQITDKFNNFNGGRNYQFQKDLVIKLYYMDLKDKLICFTPSLQRTSYLFSLQREDEIEKNQRYNFLVNGMATNGYLPGNNVTTYKHLRIDVGSNNLNLNMIVVQGNPILYAHVCMDYNDCFFDKGRVETWSQAGSLISSSKVNNLYHISIPNEANACYLKTKNSGKDDMCSTVAIVYCQGSEECQYIVSMNFDNDSTLLTVHFNRLFFV